LIANSRIVDNQMVAKKIFPGKAGRDENKFE